MIFMAILHMKEIRKMKNEELEKKLEDLRKELMRARAKIAQGTSPDKPGRVREIRRAIARILTFKRERGEVN